MIVLRVLPLSPESSLSVTLDRTICSYKLKELEIKLPGSSVSSSTFLSPPLISSSRGEWDFVARVLLWERMAKDWVMKERQEGKHMKESVMVWMKKQWIERWMNEWMNEGRKEGIRCGLIELVNEWLKLDNNSVTRTYRKPTVSEPRRLSL